MIDFPASPTNGQIFVSGTTSWVWDGTKWLASGVSAAYLPLLGGTMTGPIILSGDPTVALNPTTKQYVDNKPIGHNRIINGDMLIDQRNNGAAVVSAVGVIYTVDRWICSATVASKGTWGRVAGPTVLGFPYCLQFASSSAYAVLAADSFAFQQNIEADAVNDLAWGTANAQTVTLSFFAIGTQAGTYGGAIRNAANTRSYPFSFVLAAQTWTKITVTIPGDTAGTWVMSGSAASINLAFDLGTGSNFHGPANAWAGANYISPTGSFSVVGINGAGLAITGVKLEVGTVATPFPRETLAKKWSDCQRYFESGYGVGFNPGSTGGAPSYFVYQSGLASGLNYAGNYVIFKTTKRAAPTIVMYSQSTGASGRIRDANGAADLTPVTSPNTVGFMCYATQVTAQAAINYQANWTASAEI